MANIPVYLVGASGTPDADNPECTPCIICTLKGVEGTEETRPAIAMLDSGAYPNAIDEDFWKSIGLPITGKDTLHSVTATGEVAICSADLRILHGSGVISMRANFSISPLRKNGHLYDLVLGRQILTKFDFGFSYIENRWHLSVPEIETNRSPSQGA